MRRIGLAVILTLSLILAPLAIGGALPVDAAPEGQITWAFHVTVVPAWFDPGEPTVGSASVVLYALHDALVKPMPGSHMAPSLAESWSVSPDGLVYEFVLRKGTRFHNGEPVRAEDVKFSFERYRGADHKPFKDAVAAVEVLDPSRVRFRLKRPWPDFMTFYGGAGAAGWIVPKNYVEKVGDQGFKRAPIGSGPYKFVSFTPGVELVLEAFERYWRKTPHVKRVVLKVIPDDATRLIALKRGEVDVAYAIRGPLAEDLRRTPGLTLKTVDTQITNWVYFADQWDPKSPWHDRRVRLAANHALDRPAMNQAELLGFGKLTGSIIPSSFEFYWQSPGYAYDAAKARQLLRDAGHPRGFDAGEYFCDAAASYLGEPVINSLTAVGIRLRLRPIERAAFYQGWAEKKYRNLIQGGSSRFGNAATRLEQLLVGGGIYAHGSYADIDGLFQDQARERDPKRREAAVHRIQQLVYDKVIVAPIYQVTGLNGVGPRVEEAGLGLIAGHVFSAPYEDVKLKGK
jgi:peptide/nickel transport system substrate-binding protein